MYYSMKIGVKKIDDYKIKLTVFSILIFGFVFARDIYDININKYIFLLIAMLAYFSLDESGLIAFIAFMIPFLPGLPANYIMFAAIPIIIIKSKIFNLRIAVLAPFAFLLLELIHLFTPLSSIGEFLNFSVYIAVISMILLKEDSSYNNSLILFSYGIGVIASITTIFINSLRFASLEMIIQNGIRIGNIDWVNNSFDSTIMTLSSDQNTLGYFCAIAIAVFLILIYSNKLKSILGFPLIIITFIYGSFTMSRTFILVTIGIFFYYLIFNFNMNKMSIKRIILTLSLFLITFTIMYYYFPQLIQLITKRFEETDITGGRQLLFYSYNDYMFSSIQNLLFGIGLQNQNIKTGIWGVPHNGLQQVFVSGGIIGFILIFIWLLGMYFNNRPKKIKKYRKIYLLPLVALIAFIQGIQFLAPYIIMLPLIIAFCAIRIPDESLTYNS